MGRGAGCRRDHGRLGRRRHQGRTGRRRSAAGGVRIGRPRRLDAGTAVRGRQPWQTVDGARPARLRRPRGVRPAAVDRRRAGHQHATRGARAAGVRAAPAVCPPPAPRVRGDLGLRPRRRGSRSGRVRHRSVLGAIGSRPHDGAAGGDAARIALRHGRPSDRDDARRRRDGEAVRARADRPGWSGVDQPAADGDVLDRVGLRDPAAVRSTRVDQAAGSEPGAADQQLPRRRRSGLLADLPRSRPPLAPGARPRSTGSTWPTTRGSSTPRRG